jgi:hypothetical protein
MIATGHHDMHGDRAGSTALTERFPGESKKCLASGGISFFKINDLGERNTHRIPILDVSGLRAGMFISKGEDNGIASGDRLSTRHREDCVADSTSLNFPYPMFASGVTVHLTLRIMDGG